MMNINIEMSKYFEMLTKYTILTYNTIASKQYTYIYKTQL